MPPNVGILNYNAVFCGLHRRAGLETHSLGWPPERQACKSWAAQNLAIYAQIGEQRSVLESGPFACCMSKSERIAKATVVRGSRGDGRGEEVGPDQASEWCTKQSQRHNFLQRLIRSCPLVAPLSVRSPASFTLRCPLPLSGPLSRRRLSASPLLFPTPANAQHVVCPERQRKGKWKAAVA